MQTGLRKAGRICERMRKCRQSLGDDVGPLGDFEGK